MELIIDTNIVFSLFKSESFTREILAKHKIKLFSPEKLIDELKKYSKLICSKSNISKSKFLFNISLLPEIIELKKVEKIFKSKAKKLISHKSDADFLALALQLNIPIWSNDSHFKEQSSVKVFTTKDLVKLLLDNKL